MPPDASSRATFSPKNLTRVGMPLRTATSAMFAAGSIPRTGMPFATKCWSK